MSLNICAIGFFFPPLVFFIYSTPNKKQSVKGTILTMGKQARYIPALLLTLVLALCLAVVSQELVEEQQEYGIDCSWPIHSLSFQETQQCGNLLGDRIGLYSDFMNGCRSQFGERCDATEIQRVGQALRQPQSMVNYTSTGYQKIRAPDRLFQLIQEHWLRNKDQPNGDDEFVEKWAKGHTYVNYWKSNTTYYGLSDQKVGGSIRLHDEIMREAHPIIEQWTGMELRPTSLYGIRVYKEGAVLAPHVDRGPLVSSAIINVAQDPDMEEDWPLEVYGKSNGSVKYMEMKANVPI
jgi:hypothetical protein